jgi:cysteine synthase/rhodanese-related sulfurtransferase
MQIATEQAPTQTELQRRFTAEIKSKVPHLREVSAGVVVVNATPLVDITNEVIECAKAEFSLDLSVKDVRVFGKLDSEIYGGSIKVRPAVGIIEDAIASGKLEYGKKVFEATSGNFGIALGMLSRLGFDVIALVSRKLQSGVLDELEKMGIKLVNLDVDVCPAPGKQDTQTNLLVAKTVADNIRGQLARVGLDVTVFDAVRGGIEELLGKQDVINLAKLLARIYGGFCPEQYDNELNARAHETITGPELDQQLRALGHKLADFKVVTTFGTGGTSTGIARYLKARYEKQNLHVVFPLANQEVGGIRTREKAAGLRFYQPELYAGQHEVDFEAARRVLSYFVAKGYNLGESSALALYACIQMLNFGAGDKFIVILADGIKKYARNLETKVQETAHREVSLTEARSTIQDYTEILWTHAMFAPKEEGIEILATSLKCEENMVKVAQARDVQQVISNQEIPETMRKMLPKQGGKVLLVCMVGNTSLKIAKLLSNFGIDAKSLAGGIMGVPESGGKNPLEIVQLVAQ